MRLILLLLTLSVAAWPQALTEGAAAVAGGAVGGAAGKKVGQGVGGILDKVAGAAAKAADDKDGKQAKDAPNLKDTPTLEVGPGVARPVAAGSEPTGGSSRREVPKAHKRDRSLVPPPPRRAHKATTKMEPATVTEPAAEAADPPPLESQLPTTVTPELTPSLTKLLPPPPPPEVTPDDLKSLTTGADRLAVLKLGLPASRITMVDAGHLLEVYRYSNRTRIFGTVRLNDGVVSSIEIRP